MTIWTFSHCDFNVYLFKVHKKLTLVTCISKHFYLHKIAVIKLFYALITAAITDAKEIFGNSVVDVGFSAQCWAELKLVHNKVSVLQSPEFRTCIFEIFPPSVWSEEGWGWGAGWVVTWHIYLYLNWVGAGLNFSIARQLHAVLCSVPSLLFIPHTLHLCETVTWFVISTVSIALEY